MLKHTHEPMSNSKLITEHNVPWKSILFSPWQAAPSRRSATGFPTAESDSNPPTNSHKNCRYSRYNNLHVLCSPQGPCDMTVSAMIPVGRQQSVEPLLMAQRDHGTYVTCHLHLIKSSRCLRSWFSCLSMQQRLIVCLCTPCPRTCSIKDCIGYVSLFSS